MNDHIKVITFREFDEIADKNGFIYPNNYKIMSMFTLGIIINSTFRTIEFSIGAERTFKL